MQYYRLWIYSCNVVLAVTSTIFIIFAAFVVADFRLTLLEGVELYHPTFFYAYGALILQCGVVQTIGCLGAQRLSHKLLSIYWTLLLLLTLGDVGVGLYWVFHLEKVKLNLRPYLNREFIAKYSTDETFTLTWNKIQSQERCCGVDGPFDFERFPTSHHSKQAAFSANSHVIDVGKSLLSLPESCCTLLYAPATVSSSSSSSSRLDKTYHVPNYPPEEEHPLFSDQSPEPSNIANDEHYNYHSREFAGGGGRGTGRRSRTVINLPHKNDEPRIHIETNEQEDTEQPAVDENEDSDEEDDNNDGEMSVEYDYLRDDNNSSKNTNKTPYYLNFFHQSHGQPLAVVPDDHDDDDDDHHHHDIQPPGPHHPPVDSTVQKRDIKTYEPIHAHKVRHELHRKSQSSSLIDVKSLKNTTSSLVIEIQNVTTENFQENSTSSWSSGESNSSRNNISSNDSEEEVKYIFKKHDHVDLVRGEGEVVDLVPKVAEMHHSRQSHNNKTSKLFPSISFRVRRERRETRALLLSSSSSVTQVPAVSSAPPIQRHLVCHGQPEGLNHHNSYKKDFLDQRKTRKERKRRKGARAQTPWLNAKKLGAAWMHRKTKRTSAASAQVTTATKTSASHTALKSTSAEITDKMRANKIEKLTKILESTDEKSM